MTGDISLNPPPAQCLFGRRKGRPLRVRKSWLMRDWLPRVEIIVPPQGAFDPVALFTKPVSAIVLEIGFGGGEHLAAQATRHPSIGFIGCEPFLNGIASLLDHVEREGLTNVRLFPGDARLLLDALPAACLAHIYVLFADPWPKTRHAERRFIGPENLPRLAKALRPGGELILATDVTVLADWMRVSVAACLDFTPVSIAQTPPAGWIETRYEQKGRKAGRASTYFAYRRNESAIVPPG